ncbi:phytoene/squalene synthase family protein [Wenxinia marina]|uniref:Wenxma_18, whole genome shotgun sequence n=1 Tax=Wenxinia marina DSM 24838 TaxID=1123501 RepID=A0A0D0PZL8_9RHOB|nr:squalene/phytoene synthase family protein [Wenxinia marina]KIQ67804.1 Phytoene/squalene synthetase [Wenxinia marina DSM 24838]
MTVAACAEIVRRGDPDRFLAAMAAPVEARAALFPLYAYNVEIARAPWVSAEPMIGEMRLQWWRDAVAEIGEGKPPRAHEVVAPLAEVVAERNLPIWLLDGMAEARRRDLWPEDFADADALMQHLGATAGHLMWLSALALGAPAGLELAARDAGLAQGLAAWLQAVPDLRGRGQRPLPSAEPAAVATLARDGLAALSRARAARVGEAVPAFRAAWLAGPILRQAAARPERVLEGGLGVSEFRRRASLAWAAARGRW